MIVINGHDPSDKILNMFYLSKYQHCNAQIARETANFTHFGIFKFVVIFEFNVL